MGSQLPDPQPFRDAVEALADIKELSEHAVYDPGGGLGVRYTYADRPRPSRNTSRPSPTRLAPTSPHGTPDHQARPAAAGFARQLVRGRRPIGEPEGRRAGTRHPAPTRRRLSGA